LTLTPPQRCALLVFMTLTPRPALRAALAGRRMLVTGAALADGVGRVLARILALHGASVALADVLPLEEVAAECRALGAPLVAACAFDAAKEGDSARMVGEACAALGGPLDAIFLNHNAGCFAPMLEQPNLLGTARRLMAINFFSYAEIADAALPHLAAAARARGAPSSIVAVSSLAAELPMLDTHAYAASKAAISNWFGCLRIELRRDAALARLVSVGIVYFSAVRTATLVRAMGGTDGPNQRVLALAAAPQDAAFAVVEACVSRRPVTHFPASIALLPWLYAVWPWLARRLVNTVTVKHVPATPAAPKVVVDSPLLVPAVALTCCMQHKG
jgi:NAD(P)-dependent dehydrogenase (short-subunit alcohol dehydrogenase family)